MGSDRATTLVMARAGEHPPSARAARLRRPSWRDARLLVGLLLIFGSVLAGARVLAAADRTTPVYTARSTLSVGHQLRAQDVTLTRVRLDGVMSQYLPGGHGVPVGQVLTRPVAAGELVPRTALADAARMDLRPVAVPVSGALPEGITLGSAVDVWVAERRAGSTGEFQTPRRLAGDAPVNAITESGAGLAAVRGPSVQVLLAPEEVADLLGALANGAQVALVPVPGSAIESGS